MEKRIVKSLRCACTESHIEIVDGLCHVELVHCADNDGGSCEESEQEEKEEVERHVSHEPVKTLHWEIIPVGQGKQEKQKHTVIQEKAMKIRENQKSSCFCIF